MGSFMYTLKGDIKLTRHRKHILFVKMVFLVSHFNSEFGYKYCSFYVVVTKVIKKIALPVNK